jgi:glycylpeptide N-tetradecanoyltransferase
VNETTLNLYAMNFLCVHEKLRMKNLVPLLIEEIKRRGIPRGMRQAVWTSARVITEPLTSASFRHRLINYEKLVAVGFTPAAPGVPIEQLVKKHALPRAIRLPGFRAATPADIRDIAVKLNAYLQKFRVAQVFSEAEAAHWFVPRPGIVASYVVEREGTIDGFFSFYVVTAVVNGVPQYPTMTIAYVFYYFAKPSLLIDLARAAIQSVHWDYGADVVNALEIQDNEEFKENLYFAKGTGAIHYYLFNFAIPPVRPSEIALVLT